MSTGHRRAWPRIALISLVAACLVAIGILTGQLLAPGKLPIATALFPTAAAADSTAEAPNTVSVLDANVAEATQKQQLVQQPPAPGQPLRVQMPELGLDVPVVAAKLAADRSFNPPSNVLAYWIRDYGIAGPEAKNTLYLAAHSWNNGYAAFNPLMDQKSGSSTAKAGQKISVQTAAGRYSYSVTSVADYSKSGIAGEADLWQAVPGRLVLVTCFQLNDAGANRNLVVYAQLDAATPDPGPRK
jgi:hypothetical protein